MDRFISSTGAQLSPAQVVSEVLAFMRADVRRKYTLIIGTDSQRKNDNTADFVTAVVVHRVGNGGRYFWRRVLAHRKFYNLHDRMIEEALISIAVAKDILVVAKSARLPAFDFEIHVDVGENGATKSVIQEVTAMVRANDFEVKTKPHSYAASKVADRHV